MFSRKPATRSCTKRLHLSKATDLARVMKACTMARVACVLLLLQPLLSPGVALAQTEVRARATIPFDFWAEGEKFPAGDYILDSGFPASISIRREGTRVAVALSIVPYAGPVEKNSSRLVYVLRDGKYYLTELWGVLDKRVITAEYQHRGETNSEQREVRLMYQ